MEEKNILDIYNRLNIILSNRSFVRNLSEPKNNWLELPVEEVVGNILYFLKSLEVVEVE